MGSVPPALYRSSAAEMLRTYVKNKSGKSNDDEDHYRNNYGTLERSVVGIG